jgi:hypothetical protein
MLGTLILPSSFAVDMHETGIVWQFESDIEIHQTACILIMILFSHVSSLYNLHVNKQPYILTLHVVKYQIQPISFLKIQSIEIYFCWFIYINKSLQ